MSDIAELDPKIIDAGENKKLVLFIGAGLSCMAGIGSWQELKSELIKRFRVKPEFENRKDAFKKHLSTVSYYKCFYDIKNHDQETYYKVMKEFLTADEHQTQKFSTLLGYLMKLNPVSIVTLNIDSLLLDHNPYKTRRKTRLFGQCHPWEIPEGRLFCFHGVEDNMGGPSCGWVFSEQDLKSLYGQTDSSRFLHVLFSGVYTVLFIGFSFSDDQLLAHAQLTQEAIDELSEKNQSFHFALIPSGQDDLKFKISNYGVKPLEYKYLSDQENLGLAHQNFEKTLEAWSTQVSKGSSAITESEEIPETVPT